MEIEKSSSAASRDFPTHWGTPPSTPYSEARANWIKLNVTRDAGDPAIQEKRAARARKDLGLAELRGIVDLARSKGNNALAGRVESMIRTLEQLG